MSTRLPTLTPPPVATSGLGTRCAEAQADGVPCSEIRDCATCNQEPCVCAPPPAPPRP